MKTVTFFPVELIDKMIIISPSFMSYAVFVNVAISIAPTLSVCAQNLTISFYMLKAHHLYVAFCTNF
jgi:hypothetical protein